MAVSNGIVYAAEASVPSPLVAWRLRDGADARGYMFDSPGVSNSAPLVSEDGRTLVSAHQGSDGKVTLVVSELPGLDRVCSRTVEGSTAVEGFGGWDTNSDPEGEQLWAWYRAGDTLYALNVLDCSIQREFALAEAGGDVDFVNPTWAPDGTLWTSYVDQDGNSPDGDQQSVIARLVMRQTLEKLCVAPISSGKHGYGTPVVVPTPHGGLEGYYVVVAGNDGVVSRIEPDCSIAWSRQALRPVDGAPAYGLVHQGPAVSRKLGLVYVGHNGAWDASLGPGPDDGAVVALETATGVEVWRWSDPSRRQAFAPFVVEDYVFVRTYDPGASVPPRLVVLKADTGRFVDGIDLAPPSEPGAGSGPISAKLLCTSGTCIVASARGSTSAPGWWFVVAYNDLYSRDDNSVPFSGNEWHQNAIEPRLERAGYYTNGAVVWQAEGGYRYEHIPLGRRLVDRNRVTAKPEVGEVALSVLDWQEPLVAGTVHPVPPPLVAHLRLSPAEYSGQPIRTEVKIEGLPAGSVYRILLSGPTGDEQLPTMTASGQGVARLTIDLNSTIHLRLLAVRTAG
ncbi:MAG: hypothetical protein HY332_02300 [Chloroflexi bacterium]|nr:hypothetical protein [Chloroflexota bacterium]